MNVCISVCWTWTMFQESYLGAGSEVGVFPRLQESSAEGGQLSLKHGHSASGRGHEFICRLQSRPQSALSLARVREHPRQSVQQVLHQLRAHAQTHRYNAAAKNGVAYQSSHGSEIWSWGMGTQTHTHIYKDLKYREGVIRFKPLYSLWDSPADCHVLGWKYLRETNLSLDWVQEHCISSIWIKTEMEMCPCVINKLQSTAVLLIVLCKVLFLESLYGRSSRNMRLLKSKPAMGIRTIS